MMKIIAVVLLSFVYFCHGETSSNSSVGEMPLTYFRSSGLEEAMTDGDAFVDHFLESYEVAGVKEEIPIHAEDNDMMTSVGSTPIEEIERSELAATLNHADCDLYDQVVEIPNDQPNVLLYPSCVQIKQCGGCCGHSALACKPTQTTPMTVQVMKYIYDGKSAHPVQKVDYIQMQEHTACECQCKLTEADCNADLHYFDDWDCQCLCNNQRETCASNRRWNEEVCACTCASVQNCGTGFTFDMNSCSCSADGERAVEIDSGNIRETTTEPVQRDPCAAVECPRNYKATMFASGMCLCEYVGRG